MENNEQDELEISFGGEPSADDYRTVTSEMMPDTAGEVPERGEVKLNYPTVNELCDQRKLGICTKCGVRMAVEEYFKDGVRLDEYWGYLIGKTLFDDLLYGRHFEGSSALTMLKAANKYGMPTKEIRAKFPLKTTGTYAEFIADFKSTYGGVIPAEVLADAANHKIAGYYKLKLDPITIAKEITAGRVVIARFATGTNMFRTKDNKPTKKAKDLLPLRVPSPITGGHIMAMNEYDGLDNGMLLAGPNSWGRDWCFDNNEQEAGYYNFVFGTLAPYYFTEAWVVSEIPEAIIKTVKDLPEAKNFRHRYETNIEYGMQNDEVKKLHVALSILGYLDVKIDEYGIYGPKTAAAVLRLQKDNRLLPDWQLDQNGGRYVYQLTREVLNKKFA